MNRAAGNNDLGAIIKAQEANRRRIANREITWEDRVWLSWSPGAGLILTQ